MSWVTCVQASFLMQRPVGNRFLIQPLPLSEPNKECMVCGTAQLQLSLHTVTMTLAQFVSKARCPSCCCDGFGVLDPKLGLYAHHNFSLCDTSLQT